MLISRLPYFENTLITDSVFRSKYTSMLQELVSAIEDVIVPYREAAEFDLFEINLDANDWYIPDDM